MEKYLMSHADIQKLVHWQYIHGTNYEPVYWEKEQLATLRTKYQVSMILIISPRCKN